MQYLYINFEFDKKKDDSGTVLKCVRGGSQKVLICQKEEKGQQKILIFATLI